ncbi:MULTISPECIES: AraC family transcriptional regulator [unclassified Mycobacterium]|uniref:helix-turn-helix transcriptional regulator n=1 Tax=unclassified Mycobacterium TaxID=2642494 RepID=UPI00074049E7|nr:MULTISPECIES: AraC family transcriptional regulator [unclassified Mycobacterium]KUH83067.1 transcriptional regulator [Mycobacterium sp. IS-1556]KUH83153.1 transcriptional regulator [Mycobacterium sp. GA-0227b]KUH84436.1 transcriptional regulator [Mycobacterium sp. GA-1999]
MTARVADALPQTCCPSVWLWPGQALYAGPSLKLAPHSGSVWCLAVGIGGPLTVAIPDADRVDGRSVLIPPRLTHQLICHGEGLVSCYLEPTTSRAESCRAKIGEWHGALGSGHVDEDRLQFTPTDDAEASHWLALAAPAADRRIDPRVMNAVNRIRADPTASIPSRALAAEVGLSESRFLHLFRDELGTTVRRYRLWTRLMEAGNAIADGMSLTEAAMCTGFASPSHLSDRFKSTFGLTASQLLSSGVVVRVPDQRPRADAK